MTNEQTLFLKLIAYSLSDDNNKVPDGIEAVNFEHYYQFCEEQAILGIGFQGIERLKDRLGVDLRIPQNLLLQWIGIVEQIKAHNKLLDKRTKETSLYFASQGKRCCILKGQGNALMYPDPSLRTPGDIDVWVEGTKKEIVEYVHSRYPDINVQYHHMDYPIFEDVEVEVHYYPSFCYNRWNNYKLQNYFRDKKNEQFQNKTDRGYCAPTVSFNLIFQLSHMMRHFFTQGIGLRHVIDYYYLLKQEITIPQKEDALATMKICGMYKFFRSIMWIERVALGLNSNIDKVEYHEKAGRMVLMEMLKGGNLGHQYEWKQRGIISSYAEQIFYILRYLYLFPSEPVSRPFTLSWDYIRKILQ